MVRLSDLRDEIGSSRVLAAGASATSASDSSANQSSVAKCDAVFRSRTTRGCIFMADRGEESETYRKHRRRDSGNSVYLRLHISAASDVTLCPQSVYNPFDSTFDDLCVNGLIFRCASFVEPTIYIRSCFANRNSYQPPVARQLREHSFES